MTTIPAPAMPDLTTTFGRFVEAYTSIERRLGRALEDECALPHSWFEVMLRISRAEGGMASMGSLAEQVALTTGGITRMVDRMITTGLVERVPCPSDRRVVYATLTTAGRAKLAEARVVNDAHLREVFAAFSDADLVELDGLLDRLRPAPDVA
jgi:DNA-binding MarR family transcriptional regulator